MNPHGCNQCGSWVIGQLDVVRVQALANIHVPRGPGLADADVLGNRMSSCFRCGRYSNRAEHVDQPKAAVKSARKSLGHGSFGYESFDRVQ